MSALTQPLDITAAGCAFPSGPGLALADIALNSQLALTRKHPYFVDRCGAPVRVSVFPEKTAFDSARWWALAEAALNDLRQAALSDLSPESTQATRIWLVLPAAQRPGQPADLTEHLLAALRTWAPQNTAIDCLYGGHAAAGQAIEQASRWLGNNPRGQGIVLAIDCPLASDTLYWLEKEGLLHGSHTPYEGSARANPYGRIPGEGAAAVLLHPARQHPALATLIGLGLASEPILHNDPRPSLGQGLSTASRQALEQAARNGQAARWFTRQAEARPQVSTLYTDLNGEPYRGDEYGFTLLRISGWLQSEHQRQAPALISGDLGSASLITHLALSAWRLHQTTSQSASENESSETVWHLLLASSDDAERAALVLIKPDDATPYSADYS